MKNIKSKMILSLAVIGILSSCEKEFTKTVYPEPQPTTRIGHLLAEANGVMASLYNDTTYTLTPGLVATEVSYLSYHGHAMRAFFFEVDLSDDNLTISQTTPENKRIGESLQRATEQAALVDSEDNFIWGGINGDFFDGKKGTNMPFGFFWHHGVEEKDYFNPDITRESTIFYINDQNTAGIAMREDYEKVKAENTIIELTSGGHLLVGAGNATKPGYDEAPRTCIGVSQDGKKVYMMVVDGRRYEYSFGMTLDDVAMCMQAIGAYNAINLDGGGSSTFYIRTDDIENRFQIRNWPTDNGGLPRKVANCLTIISKK